MLDFKKNRLDYGTLLMPPEKFELTHAVGTTYSLDLHTLFAIPVALFYSKMLEGSFEETRFDVIESIQETAKKLNIYCQKGKIQVPRQFNWLFAYLEDSIHEISPPSHLSSFHPKVWVLRFEKNQEIRYRVIVLSRNLTFDRSWDLAFYVDGALKKGSHAKNKPLQDFLRYLFNTYKVEEASQLLNDLPYVEFENVDGFKSFTFHPIGIDAYQHYTNPLDQRALDKLLVVTPFVDRTTLKKLHQNCPGKKVLISREEELQKMPPLALQGYEPYFLSRSVVEGEAIEDLEEADSEPQRQELHAKLFVGQHQRRYYWFLGSANCTDPAFTRNTEFMVELEGETSRVGPGRIQQMLISPDDGTAVFEYYDPNAHAPEENAEGIRQLIRKLEYDLANTPFSGKLISRQNTENYDLYLTADLGDIEWDENIRVKAAPLNLEKNNQSIYPNCKNELAFENLSEIELSQFVALSIYHESDLVSSFLVKIQIVLPETRKAKILKNLIASREKFFKYLDFLISGDPYYDDSMPGDAAGKEKHSSSDRMNNQFLDLPIFEHLLLTASRSPKKLYAIDRLIRKLQDEDDKSSERIIPEDFHEFWDTFKQAAGIK